MQKEDYPMIVRKIDAHVFQKPRRNALTGKGWDMRAKNQEKGFEQYLIEAFQGEVVQDGKHFSSELTSLARRNLVRLSQI